MSASNSVLVYSPIFSAYELVYAMISLQIYLDLVNVYRPALTCNIPNYLEITTVLNEMLRYKRVYKLGGIFNEPKSVKDQTIRGYISQRKKIEASKIASLLYTNYINREDSEIAFIGNRSNILRYICKMVKEGDVAYIGKEKELDVLQINGETKFTSTVNILIAVKLRSGL